MGENDEGFIASILKVLISYWLALLSLLSVVPVHFAFFALAIPEPFRPLLDLNFQLYLSAVFASHVVVAFFAGRFIYVGIVGIFSNRIRRKVTDFARNHPVLGPEGEMRSRNFSSIAAVGAYQAIHDKDWVKYIRKLERLGFFALHRNRHLAFLSRRSTLIMFGLSLFIFGLTYLGLIVSIGFILAATPTFLIVQGAEVARLKLRQRTFLLNGRKTVNWDWTGPNTLAVFAMILLLFSAAAGYLREYKLASSSPIYLSLGESVVPIAVIASTRSGLLAYDGVSKSYKFFSFGDFGSIVSKRE
jgi:hypothetical protein